MESLSIPTVGRPTIKCPACGRRQFHREGKTRCQACGYRLARLPIPDQRYEAPSVERWAISRLHAVRTAKGLTQTSVAAAMRSHKSQIAKLERCGSTRKRGRWKRGLSLQVIVRYARAVGVPLAMLFAENVSTIDLVRTTISFGGREEELARAVVEALPRLEAEHRQALLNAMLEFRRQRREDHADAKRDQPQDHFEEHRGIPRREDL